MCVNGPVNKLNAAHTAAVQNGLFRPLLRLAKWELGLNYPINPSAGGPSPLYERPGSCGAGAWTRLNAVSAGGRRSSNYSWAHKRRTFSLFHGRHLFLWCDRSFGSSHYETLDSDSKVKDIARLLQLLNNASQGIAVATSYINYKQIQIRQHSGSSPSATTTEQDKYHRLDWRDLTNIHWGQA